MGKFTRFLYTSSHHLWALGISDLMGPFLQKNIKTAAFCFPVVSQCGRTEDKGGNSRMVKCIHFRTRWDSGQHLVRSPCCCSVAQSCPTVCYPMDCSTPGFPVLHYLLELAQTHVHWVSDAFQPSCPLSSPLPLLSVFPSTRVFSSESALHIMWSKYWSFSFSIALPINIQDWFSLGLIGLISLQSKGLSSIFSKITVQKHQLFGAWPSLWSNSRSPGGILTSL